MRTDNIDAWLTALTGNRRSHPCGSACACSPGRAGDRIVGVMGGTSMALIEDATEAITVTEQLTGRKLDPFARGILRHELR